MSLTDKIRLQLEEANRLHASIETRAEELDRSASETLIKAWQAGHALVSAKRLLKALEGHGTWEKYAREHFQGSLPTATRYMQLAKSFTTVKDLPPTSLVEAYRQLRMISKPNPMNAMHTPRPPKAPGRAIPPGRHILQARAITTMIRTTVESRDAQQIKRLQMDFASLRHEMGNLYSSAPHNKQS